MVSENAENHLHTLLLQRLQVLFLVIEQVLHVLIVIVIHLTALSIVVDVTGEKNNLVKDILLRLLQRVTQVVQRIGIVHLHTADDLQAVVLMAVRHLGNVTYKENKLTLVL